jgi:aminoglycoside 6'-N-acetyltransferase I
MARPSLGGCYARGVRTATPRVRIAAPPDVGDLSTLRAALWPEGSREEHLEELRAIVGGAPRSTLPLVVLVAVVGDEGGDEIVGFVEVGLRSHADGCDTTRPVGFIEGWYVSPSYRRQQVGRALLLAAEDWCRAQGCAEVASDTWLDNVDSQRAHEALGFEVVDRCVTYRKSLKA